MVYGAAGAIGGAVARAFARDGARVFLAGRTLARLQAVAQDIRSRGGTADTAVLAAELGSSGVRVICLRLRLAAGRLTPRREGAVV
ncbi:MAG TPA: SDR family NAD(P)-dependent oxidoreductase [Albitalea sp.]|uniref:SDR family NAD(P)-dependent oxidoreductase n=1 Tax=Piscinibacter sp. TaxID=1903157 RepID=UPI002ED0EBE1